MHQSLCFLLVLLVLGAACSGPPPAVISPSDCQKALGLAHQQLEKRDYRHAYDSLLAAMRLDPGEPGVLDEALQFVSRLSADFTRPRGDKGADQDDPMELARDIYARADALIPFQPLDRLILARDQYIKTGRDLHPSGNPSPSPATAGQEDQDALGAIDRQMAAATDNSIPVEVRTELMQRARAELEDAATRYAAGNVSPAPASFWDRWRASKAKLEDAENKVLSAAYESVHAGVADWLEHESVKQLDAANAATGDQASGMIKTVIDPALENGARWHQRLAPYREAKISQAEEDDRGVARRLNDFERSRGWLYNASALGVIKKIETQPKPPDDRYANVWTLAAIDESRLNDYVDERFRNAWKKSFDPLDDDEKEEATKMRLTRQEN